MRATGWNNGAWHASGAGYGIRISREDRDRHFDREWPDVEIALPSQVTATVSVSKSFWNCCSELRSAEIGLWMISAGFAPWQGNPPVMDLARVDKRRFRLTQLSPQDFAEPYGDSIR